MATSSGARSSRRSRTAKATADETGSAVKVEEDMAREQATSNGTDQTPKPGKLELAQRPESAEANGHEDIPHEESGLAVLAGSGEIEVAESFTSAGVRPIAASHLEVFGTILNNRPIMASHLRVIEYSIPGNRPIFASEMIVRDDLTLPGGRPIMASDPHLLEATTIVGGRPIASNEIDDSETLMGFID